MNSFVRRRCALIYVELDQPSHWSCITYSTACVLLLLSASFNIHITCVPLAAILPDPFHQTSHTHTHTHTHTHHRASHTHTQHRASQRGSHRPVSHSRLGCANDQGGIIMASKFSRILSSGRTVGLLSLLGAGSLTAAALLHRERLAAGGAHVRRIYPAR